MNTMNPAKAAPPKATDKEMTHRPVTIVLGEASGGRIPVTLTVVPVADLEALGGVFVDFRLGTKDPSDVPMVVDGTDMHVSSIKKGDDAVAALAEKEAADARLAADPDGVEVTEPIAAAAPAKKKMEAKHPIISHQIAQGRRLTVGQAESFKAEVTQPEAAPEGERWYVRGRFATSSAHDLKSAWVRV